MHLFVVEGNDPRAVRVGGGDNELMSITRVREAFQDAFKDGIYTLKDPHGNPHTFTLDPWEGRDPDRTFLQISFRSATPGAFGRGAAPLFP